MNPDSQELIWTIVSNTDGERKTVTEAGADNRFAIARMPYAPDQVAAFAQSIQGLCYKVNCRDYEEDENLGIRYNETNIVSHKPIPLTDWVVENDVVIGFVPAAYPYKMLTLRKPDKSIWFLGSHSKIKGYSYDNPEYTYWISSQPMGDPQ